MHAQTALRKVLICTRMRLSCSTAKEKRDDTFWVGGHATPWDGSHDKTGTFPVAPFGSLSLSLSFQARKTRSRIHYTPR
jgi:hypothetical protein